VKGTAERCLFIMDYGKKKSHRSFVILVALVILSGACKKRFFEGPLTTAVIGTCVWAGVDNAWEQRKLKARKMLENAAESHTSGACFVRRFCYLQEP